MAKKDAKSALAVMAFYAYIFLGLIQSVAIVDVEREWWGMHWVLALPFAVIVAYVPVVGTIVGVLGAVQAWSLRPWVAILLFCWPYIVILAALGAGGISAFTQRSVDG